VTAANKHQASLPSLLLSLTRQISAASGLYEAICLVHLPVEYSLSGDPQARALNNWSRRGSAADYTASDISTHILKCWTLVTAGREQAARWHQSRKSHRLQRACRRPGSFTAKPAAASKSVAPAWRKNMQSKLNLYRRRYKHRTSNVTISVLNACGNCWSLVAQSEVVKYNGAWSCRLILSHNPQ
jgi:hypothetical protein